MSLIICGVCGKVKQVHGTSGGTLPLIEVMTVKEWCHCPPSVGWGHYTLAPVDWRDAELARLRADLAEARADVQRFEAALDVSQRELAEARAADVEADILDAIEAVCELADAEYVRYREQWAGLRESVIDDNARDIGKVRQWLTERDIVRKGGKARDSRRTIRALVVAFRDALHLTRRVASDDAWNLWLQLVQRQAHERRESERNQTSRD